MTRLLLLAFAAVPFLLVAQQDAKQEPTAEQVFKNIQVFKGVPASDLIPSMEFMAASLKYQCEDCHNPQDYAAETRTKETARHMILMQRDINTKNFNGRTQVTCMTCHRGAEHPVGTPMPDGVALRHARVTDGPNPSELFIAHLKAANQPTAALVRTGTLTAPNDTTHKMETVPLELIQAPGGKFRIVAADRKIGSDGKAVWYGSLEMNGEPAAVFSRIGRTWWGGTDFSELTAVTLAGKDTIGKSEVFVVRATRPSTTSTEETYFDSKSKLLSRLVNIKRSTLGNVVSSIDYSNYKTVDKVKVPMKVVVTFAGGEQWIMDLKSAKFDPSVSDSVFKVQ